MFLLDTNVVSELRRQRPHGGVLAWIKSVGDSEVFMSAVTVGEIQTGIERTRNQDAAKAGEIEVWLEDMIKILDVLVIDAAIIRLWARLMLGKSKDCYEDALIAATALVHGLTVVTRDTRDFLVFEVATLNPFLPA